jgi:hypothetical protein
VRRGKTPVLTEDQARRLLASIKVVRKVALGDGAEAEEPWLVGLRDRALMAVMTYTFARVSAVVAMRVEDYLPGRQALVVRLHEKGGKRHELPAHHKLEQFLDEYLAVAGIRENGKTPLFRSALGEAGVLTDKPMNRVDAYGALAHGRRRLQGQARLLVSEAQQEIGAKTPAESHADGEHSARLNDAGVANASDTSYIYDVFDSHPILSDLTAAIPAGRKVVAEPLWAACRKPLCGRRLNCASSDWPWSGRWR